MNQDSGGNPFGDRQITEYQSNAIGEVLEQREIAEVKATVLMAKQFPRDEQRSMERILQSCRRKTLAEMATYEYTRGGTDINGPSIRLAEAIAQAWGNMVWGVRELDQRDGVSSVESFAWDLESNARQMKAFQVPHIRDRSASKGGPIRLTDARDIYELVANMGARRMRACILGIIPGDVIDAALAECDKTLRTNVDLSTTNIQRMVDTFAGQGVSKEQLEAFCQCNMSAIRATHMVRLGKIYTSLKDGMGKPEDFFQPVIHPAGAKNKQWPTGAAEAGSNGGKPSFGAESTNATDANSNAKTAEPTGFEAYLIDEYGEVAADLYTDPTKFLNAAEQLLTKSKDKRLVLENNDDAITAAVNLEFEKHQPIMTRITQIVEGKPSSEVTKSTPSPSVVEPPIERGKPTWTAYVKLFREALAQQTVMGIPAWLDAQRAMLATVPMAQRLLAIRDANERAAALGVGLPAWIGDLSRPAAKKAGNPAVQAGQGAAGPSDQGGQQTAQAATAGQPSAQNGQTGQGKDDDAAWAKMMTQEIEVAETLDDLRTMTSGAAVQSRMARFLTDRPELHAQIVKTADVRWRALGGT